MNRSFKQHTLIIGKCDHNGSGLRDYTASVDWSVTLDGRFSMSGNVYHTSTKGYRMGGQCLDEILKMFPNHSKLKRMVAVWKRWHLNDMRAGTPAQETFLRETKEVCPPYPVSHYEWASKLLADAGLNPDPSNSYKYGSAWLVEALPDDVVAEINSWL